MTKEQAEDMIRDLVKQYRLILTGYQILDIINRGSAALTCLNFSEVNKIVYDNI